MPGTTAGPSFCRGCQREDLRGGENQLGRGASNVQHGICWPWGDPNPTSSRFSRTEHVSTQAYRYVGDLISTTAAPRDAHSVASTCFELCRSGPYTSSPVPPAILCLRFHAMLCCAVLCCAARCRFVSCCVVPIWVLHDAIDRRDWRPSSGALQQTFSSLNTNTNASDAASSRSNGRTPNGDQREETLSVRRKKDDAGSQRGQRCVCVCVEGGE